DHILYLLLKYEFLRDDMFNGWDWRVWNRYDKGLSDYGETGENPATSRARARHRAEIEFNLFVQFVAYRQLKSLMDYARVRGVEFAIDRPLSLEGADIWMNPDIFALSSKNGYQRLTTQGVPGEPGQWNGQYWQFFPYDWSNPRTEEFVLAMSDFYRKLGFGYERKDHVLGYYRTFHYVEDVENNLELDKLKVDPQDRRTLYERVMEIRDRVLALPENSDEEKKAKEKAKEAAVDEVVELFKKTFVDMRSRGEHPSMPHDALHIAFDENGDLYPDNALRIARKLPEASHGQTLDASNVWLRQDVVEKKVFKRESVFDSLAVTPSVLWKHPGFMRQYLFPESYDPKEVLEAPQPDDRLLLGYFKLNPAERVLSRFLAFAQENGTQEIWETLGSVPPPISASTRRRLGGPDIVPLIWGFLPEDDFHVSKIPASSFVIGSDSNWSTLPARWENELTMEQKTRLLDDWLPNVTDKEKHLTHFTPEVHKAMLTYIYKAPGKMVVPFWLDILGLNDDYRINHPGMQYNQWEMRLPLDATIEALLAAAQGKETNPTAQKAVEMLRYVQSLRPKRTFDGKTTEILSVDPAVGGTIMQIRELHKPFLVDAYIHGPVREVRLVVLIEGREVTVPMHVIPVAAGLPGAITKYTAGQWSADKPGIYEFYVTVATQDGKTLMSEKGKFFAVPEDADLNPLAQEYIGYQYGLGKAPERAQLTSRYPDAASYSSVVSKIVPSEKTNTPLTLASSAATEQPAVVRQSEALTQGMHSKASDILISARAQLDQIEAALADAASFSRKASRLRDQLAAVSRTISDAARDNVTLAQESFYRSILRQKENITQNMTNLFLEMDTESPDVQAISQFIQRYAYLLERYFVGKETLRPIEGFSPAKTKNALYLISPVNEESGQRIIRIQPQAASDKTFSKAVEFLSQYSIPIEQAMQGYILEAFSLPAYPMDIQREALRRIYQETIGHDEIIPDLELVTKRLDMALTPERERHLFVSLKEGEYRGNSSEHNTQKRTFLGSPETTIEGQTNAYAKLVEAFKNPSHEAFDLVITKEDIKNWELRKWVDTTKSLAKKATAGMRDTTDIVYPWNPHYNINLLGTILTALAYAQMLQDKFARKDIDMLVGGESRYGTGLNIDMLARAWAARGIKVHRPQEGARVTIWQSSFITSLKRWAGGIYFTSSHSARNIFAGKILSEEGSQLLIEEMVEMVELIDTMLTAVEKGEQESLTISFAAKDDSRIREDVDNKTHPEPIDTRSLYVDYLKKGIATQDLLSSVTQAQENGMRIGYAMMHGSMT
ncbi:MAG: 4-alpha-glucanotransferase, partial [Candidatus Omnitrophica bacterium]|nr:4-alpha-glucanotransferase [Candidatus Omnitrophota bacterium]